jgi:hypothetical protein
MWIPTKLQWALICLGFLFAFYVDTRGIGPVSNSGLGLVVSGAFYFFSGMTVTILTAISVMFLVWTMEGLRREQ